MKRHRCPAYLGDSNLRCSRELDHPPTVHSNGRTWWPMEKPKHIEEKAYAVMYATQAARTAVSRARTALANYHQSVTGPTYLAVLETLKHIDRARRSAEKLTLTARER
jgi:hypothetical protein